MMIAIYRLGAHIVLPGIDATQLKTGSNNGGILGLIDSFSGGAFNNASIFALGIMPYISASIFMQLMTVLVPRFQKMQKEGDSGRKKNYPVHPLSYSRCYHPAGISLCYLSQGHDRTNRWYDAGLFSIQFLVDHSGCINSRNLICNVDGRKDH